MPNDDNALRPLNGSINNLCARARGHNDNIPSRSREAEADKENVYPQLSQGKDIEDEREKVRWRQRGMPYEHVEQEDEDEQDQSGMRERTGSRSLEVDDTQEASPFVRGAGRGESARHRDAYEQMTALAASLPRIHAGQRRRSESPSGTPAHKKRRLEEIVESDGMSEYEPGTPVRHRPVQQDHHRLQPRMHGHSHMIPDESVDGEMEGSMISGLEDTTSLLDDLRDETPSHPNDQICKSLQAEFPGHRLRPFGEKIKCHDCDKALVQVHETNLKRHLTSKGHIAAYELRVARDKASNMAPSRLSEVGSVASSSHEFTRPLPVSFNSFRNESLDQARTQYLSLLESETMSARNRDGALDKKIDDLETRRVKAVQDLKTEITKLAQELSQRMSELSNMQQISADQIRYAEAGQKDAAAKAEEQFRAVDEKMESLQRSLKACKESVSRAEKASRDSAQEMAGREQNIETKVSNFAGRLTKNRDDTNKEFEAVKESIEKLKKNEVRPSKFKSLEEKVTASRVQSEETAESIRKLKASATKVTDLESKFNVQEERLDSFELSAQVMNDGLKASREDNMQHASILVDLRSTVAELQNTAASARHCVDTLESTLNDREKSMEESLEDSFRQQLDDLRTETDTKFAAQQLEYQNDVTGLIQALEEQKEMLQKQSDIISTQSAKLDRQQAVLDEYSTTIQNQNMIINMQSGGIESNDSRVKSQGRELKAQAEVIEHLKKTVPAFMKDLRLVDDKIEDYIDEQAVKEGKWTAEVSKHSCKCGTNERVHTSGKKSSKRVFSSQHRNGGRKARFVPRFRRRQHAMFAHILRIYASRALTTLTECMWQPHQLEKENN